MAEMTQFQVLLVDDDGESRRVMRELLSEYSDICVAGEASCREEAMAFLERHPVRVVFSDIQMEGGSGFDLAAGIHRRYPDMLVVFLTGFADFAVDGYLYGPVDFLVKPVSRERLERAVTRIRERLTRERAQEDEGRIGLRMDGGFRVISVRSIAYVEKEDRRVRIIWKDGTSDYTTKTMQELESVLLTYDFFRCHKSYLAPLRDIVRMRKEPVGRYYKLYLKGDIELPLSRSKYYELQDILGEGDGRELS